MSRFPVLRVGDSEPEIRGLRDNPHEPMTKNPASTGPTFTATLLLAALGLLLAGSPASGAEYVLELRPPRPGIAVWVDDRPVDRTDGDGRVLVQAAPGDHVVGVELDGEFVSRKVAFDPEINFVPVDLGERVSREGAVGAQGQSPGKAERSPIEYLVKTNVPGAAVHVDGVLETTTNESGRSWIVLLEGSEHLVEITKPGHESFETRTVARPIGNVIEAELESVEEQGGAAADGSAPGSRPTEGPRVGPSGGQAAPSADTRSSTTPGWLHGALVAGIVALAGVLALLLHRKVRRDRQESAEGAGDHVGTSSLPAQLTPGSGGPLPDLGAEYNVLGLLRRGGQAEIYLAESLSGDGARYAVKLPLSSEEVGRSALDAFFEEADQSRRLLNPHIITVYKAGMDATTRRPFYIMDFFPGPSLREMLRSRGPFPEVDVLERILLPILYGLEYAHSRTPPVIHKDLKPENVLVRADEDGRVSDLKLIDFGLSFTRDPGVFPGTPPYVAPELLDGDETNPTSDLFSLGVMTLELLTGRPPFFADSVRETRTKILAGEYASDNLSRPVAAIVDRLLAVNRSERYQNAEEVILDCRDTLFSSRNTMTATPGRAGMARSG